MTIGIYFIEHSVSGKMYVGKSVNIEHRISSHKCNLRKKNPSLKSINRYLHAAVQKYGWGSFETGVLETFDSVDERLIGERELYWMDHFDTCNTGYNLRRDTSTGMIVHPETRKLKSAQVRGENNPNFGNNWSPEQKQRMSEIKRQQHIDGTDGITEDVRKRKGEITSKFWKDNPDIKERMSRKVSKSKQKYNFHQLNEDGSLVKIWPSVEDIIKVNPEWKWQNIYSVCNGYKKRIYGFKWKKVLKDENKT